MNAQEDPPPRLGMSQYFAGEHLAAAKFMATSCQVREVKCGQDGITGVDTAARSYALGAIVESVAFLEAAISDFLRDAKEFGLSSPYVNGFGQEPLNLLLSFLNNRRVGPPQSTLDKYDLTLLCASKKPIDRGRSPGQDVAALVRARNDSYISNRKFIGKTKSMTLKRKSSRASHPTL